MCNLDEFNESTQREDGRLGDGLRERHVHVHGESHKITDVVGKKQALRGENLTNNVEKLSEKERYFDEEQTAVVETLDQGEALDAVGLHLDQPRRHDQLQAVRSPEEYVNNITTCTR